MYERLLLVEHSVVLLLLFIAIGSGPATGLIRNRYIRLATMPILGFALAASLLTTVALFLTMATAAWVVLIPAAVVSLAAAVVLARRRPAIGRTREIRIPAVMLLIGMTLALAPPVSRGTQGPFALGIWDSWSYAATSVFLQHHRSGDRLPASAVRTDLTMAYGASNVRGGARIGVDTVNAAAATLFGSDSGASLAPFLAVLFGLTPVLVWLIVRGFGGSWQAAAFGSALGLTPAILSLVEDTTLGNLAGGVLAASALFFIVRSARGSVGDAVVAGAVLGGLVAAYPEFLLPLFLVAACVGLVFAIDRARRGGAPSEWIFHGVSRVGVAAVTTVLVAPVAVSRAVQYLSARASDGPWAQGLPLRNIDLENVGSWAFGLHHIYEMSAISALPRLQLVFAVFFPIVLAVVVVFGIARLRVLGVFVAAPVLVAVTLGIFSYHRFQSGHCEYCEWKAFTFMIPFLAVGLAFGVEWIWRGHGPRNAVYLQRVLAASIAILALAAIANADRNLIQATRSLGAFCPYQLRDLGKRLDRLPSKSPILIEGTGAMPLPFFMTPAAYFVTRGHKEPVLFDAGTPPWGVDYLGLISETAGSYYSPSYRYVLTSFEDVRSNRTPLGHYGPFLLAERAPIDVVVSPNQWAVDNTAPRIPWVSTPFTLRVSSPRTEDASITFSLARPAGGGSTLTFASGPQRLEQISTSPSEVCVNVHLAKGSTDIVATPALDPPIAPKPQQLTKELGLAAITAAPGPCGAGH